MKATVYKDDLIHLQERADAWSRGVPGVSCQGRGCFGCCRASQPVLPGEAERIAAVLRPDQVQRVRTFKAGGMAALCPLLENGACGIYEARPVACRLLVTTGPTTDCYPEAGQAQHQAVDPPPDLGRELVRRWQDGGRRMLGAELQRVVGNG